MSSIVRWFAYFSFAAVLAPMLAPSPASALPKGYFVWSKGKLGSSSDRKIYRMTLPDKSGVKALTSGEDISCQVSPDGRWVAYAKAKLTGGTDYHSFNLWSVYLVSINGGTEIKIDDDGYWPSWGTTGSTLYFSQVDGKHTKIVRATIDAQGKATGKSVMLSTKTEFSSIPEINECFVAPDGKWFAGRTRGASAYNGVGAYLVDPPTWNLLGKAGSTGCMPYVAPGGKWGFHAGSSYGIRWGDAPEVPNRKQDQQLIPPKGSGYKCYHPGISTDEKWVMTGQSTDSDQNAGAWDIFIYRLDPATRKVSGEQMLVSSGFNGWPHLWVDEGGTSPADSGTTPTSDSGPGNKLDAGPMAGQDATGIAGDGPGAHGLIDNVLEGGCALLASRGPTGYPGGALLVLVSIWLWTRRRAR